MLARLGEAQESFGVASTAEIAAHPGLSAAQRTACRRFANAAATADACARGFFIGVGAFGRAGVAHLKAWRAAARKADALVWRAQSARLAPWDRRCARVAAVTAQAEIAEAAKTAKLAVEAAAQASAEVAVKTAETTSRRRSLRVS